MIKHSSRRDMAKVAAAFEDKRKWEVCFSSENLLHNFLLDLQFPLLRPGEREFVYESCKPLPSSEGSVEGYFTFVPGRLSEPKGDPFRVAVAQFPLKLPDYIF